jgi:Tfp pilus assembly protein PilF
VTRRTAAATPDAANELLRHGLTLAASGRLFEAAAAFQAALRLDPELVPALLNLGTAYRHLGQRDCALPCYRLAARLAPDRPEALYLYGTLLCELRELEEAIDVHRWALALAPDQPGVLSDLGSALVLRGGDADGAEGMALLRRAVELAPDWPVAHVNLGVALLRRRRMAAALRCFRAAQRVDAGCDYARFCESNLHLMRGDYPRGYALYDAHRAVYPPRYRERLWDGVPLAGRTVLLYAQHGLGDTLQFVRYVSRAAALGGRVVLQVQPQLLPLLGRQPGAVRVLSNLADPGSFDVQASLLELPAVLGDTLDTIPADVPYLAADRRLRRRWAHRLAGDGGFKVGLVWHGNPKQKDGLVRSCRLADMAPVWELHGVSAYSLQVGVGSEELAELAGGAGRAGTPPVRDLGALDVEAGAFMDTAAIVDSLDLVVTVDTSVAHLAGGLGRPVWMVVPYWADWRWMVDRDDSPWYPTMRIFRQRRPGAWGPVFAELAAALEATMQSRIARPPLAEAVARRRPALRNGGGRGG